VCSAETGGAALDVRVGSWHDPLPFPGLAHAVEHCLFLGTIKYPVSGGQHHDHHDDSASGTRCSLARSHFFPASPPAPPHRQLSHWLQGESDYNAYLAAHGGASNAYTDLEDTNYYFTAAASGMEGALDRFAQFFIAPTFNASSTGR